MMMGDPPVLVCQSFTAFPLISHGSVTHVTSSPLRVMLIKSFSVVTVPDTACGKA